MPRNLIVLALATMLMVMPASAKDRAPCVPRAVCKVECDKTRTEIRRIQARMRQGYSATEGAKLEARLRELRKRRSKICP